MGRTKGSPGVACGSPSRRRVLKIATGLLVLPSGGASAEPGAGALAAFFESVWPAAKAAGVGRATFDLAGADLAPDPTVLAFDGRQSEFDRPLSAYFKDAVAASRIARGAAAAKQWAGELARITAASGVPGPIILAAWAMESDFGRSMGDRDVVRSLATLGQHRPDRPLFRDELVAALVMLERGDADRAKLRGSWAGAMGGPQFLPSAYLRYAIRYAGAGAPDIWTNVPDTLASIGNFLKLSGWRAGLPWGAEVTVPKTFDYRALEADFAAFRAQGLTATGGHPLPQGGAATLFFPAGAAGPAFLLSDNYWVLKQYNNSDSYALSLAGLADRIAGGRPLSGQWPAHEKIWSRADKSEVQTRLAALGLYTGAIDGRFGPTSRAAIHSFQRATGVQPADGYPADNLLQTLRAK